MNDPVVLLQIVKVRQYNFQNLFQNDSLGLEIFYQMKKMTVVYLISLLLQVKKSPNILALEALIEVSKKSKDDHHFRIEIFL